MRLLALLFISTTLMAQDYPSMDKEMSNIEDMIKKIDDNSDIKDVDIKKTEVKKAETPKIETPKTEVPKPEVPKTDLPKVIPTKVDAPSIVAPKTDTPKVEAPKVEIKKVEVKKEEIKKEEVKKEDVKKEEIKKIAEPKAIAPVTAPVIEPVVQSVDDLSIDLDSLEKELGPTTKPVPASVQTTPAPVTTPVKTVSPAPAAPVVPSSAPVVKPTPVQLPVKQPQPPVPATVRRKKTGAFGTDAMKTQIEEASSDGDVYRFGYIREKEDESSKPGRYVFSISYDSLGISGNRRRGGFNIDAGYQLGWNFLYLILSGSVGSFSIPYDTTTETIIPIGINSTFRFEFSRFIVPYIAISAIFMNARSHHVFEYPFIQFGGGIYIRLGGFDKKSEFTSYKHWGFKRTMLFLGYYSIKKPSSAQYIPDLNMFRIGLSIEF